MIWMLIFIGVLVLGIVGMIMYCNLESEYELLLSISIPFVLVATIVLFIMFGVCISSHVTADRNIQLDKIEYEGIINRLEIINSDYEDVSKSDVIRDVVEWNKHVYLTKHWGNSKWTNWFYSKKYVDSLQYIEYDMDKVFDKEVEKKE